MAHLWCGRQCVSLPAFASYRQLSCLTAKAHTRPLLSSRGGIQVRHGQQNSWLMNYTLEELFFSARGGANVFAAAGSKKGAASMKEQDILMFHDSKHSQLNKYALPGINVPQHVLKYPKELTDSEVETTRKKFAPREEKGVTMLDVSDPDEVKRYKWLNRFNTHYMPDAKGQPLLVKRLVPTFYPGTKSDQPVREVMVLRKGVGYTGGVRVGQTLGPPESKYLEDDVAQDFQSVLVDIRRISHSRPSGRHRSIRAIVVVGNGNGLVGFECASGRDFRIAARKARNKAILHLYHVDLCDNHTIYRNMDVRRGRTRMFWHRKEAGYGVHCHRISKSICQLAGIKDVHAKIRGCTSPLSVIGATFKALTGQLDHHDFANQTGKHVVQMRRENGYRPIVVASPKASVKKPSPLLKITKQPYTGMIPLPYELQLTSWYSSLSKAEAIQAEEGKKIITEHIEKTGEDL